MKLRSVPLNEKARLEALRSYHILDTEEEQEYDDIVELACQLCDTPIAFIITSKDKVWIHFSDNGIGIEEKHVPKIFDMFYQGSESSKGSGLGLYIVKETVSRLEGTVKVESEYGIATTFSISIPNSGHNHSKSQS